MNSDPNSDSKQYPESKLSRVHNAPTHGPGCAQAAPALHHVVARAGPYRGPLPGRVAPVPDRVSAPTRTLKRCVARRAAPCRSPSDRIARLLHPIVAHAQPYGSATAPRVAVLLRAVSQCYCAPCRSATARRVAACLAIHPAARPPSCHDTKTVS